MKEIWKQTIALEGAFDKAFNPKLNTVNIQAFNKSLKVYAIAFFVVKLLIIYHP